MGRPSGPTYVLFVVKTTTAAVTELPAALVGFLCPCHPCAKLQHNLAVLHRAQATPVSYAHLDVTSALLQVLQVPSVPTSQTTGAKTLHLMVADSATTPSSSSS